MSMSIRNSNILGKNFESYKDNNRQNMI